VNALSVTFEARLEGLAMLCRDWQTNELFKETMKELVSEIGAEALGGDPVCIIKRVKALQALIVRQERWLLNQREALQTPGVKWIM